jgi:hypothetical protein
VPQALRMSRWGLFPTVPSSREQPRSAPVAAGGGVAAARARRREEGSLAGAVTDDGMEPRSASVSVAVRMRPFSPAERARGEAQRPVSCGRDHRTVSVEMKDGIGGSTGSPRGMTKDFVFSRFVSCSTS